MEKFNKDDIEIIYHDNNFVIAHKPDGMNFHSEEGAGFVVLTTQKLGVEQLYSVHRLDKMTSGLIILAKNSVVANLFTTMFENRQIEKYYLAISLRKPKKKQGWIKADMTASRRGSYKLTKTMDNPAITQFKSTSLRTHERLFIIKPHTGKTHQIRVALKSIGAPIAGDIRYANADEAKEEDRGYLHAYVLKFVFKNENFTFIAKPNRGERFLSQMYHDTLEAYEKPWELF